jgi:hypothetical protein
MKELEDENRRLRKLYMDEKLKAEIVSEALAKNGEAISKAREGHWWRTPEAAFGQRCITLLLLVPMDFWGDYLCLLNFLLSYILSVQCEHNKFLYAYHYASRCPSSIPH